MRDLVKGSRPKQTALLIMRAIRSVGAIDFDVVPNVLVKLCGVHTLSVARICAVGKATKIVRS